MTPYNDNDLIDRLQSAIAERQSGITAPEGIGDAARRAAHRRTATRALGAGVPMLAAAGVATVLAVGSGSGSTAASGPSAAPVRVQDTAYIVKRVKAKVADDIQGGTVTHSYTYESGDVGSDGALVNLGAKNVDGYEYAAPDGSSSWRTNSYDGNGNLVQSFTNDLTPDGTGKYDDTRTFINPGPHTYSQDRFSGLSNPTATAAPNLFSSPSEVQQALQTGQVTQTGSATINGTPAIALAVKTAPSTISGVSGTHTVTTDLTLYVNAQTYQPLRTVLSFGGVPGLLVGDWVPATPENIAQATDDSIPAGYTQVNDTH